MGGMQGGGIGLNSGVVQYNSLANFPAVGNSSTIYIAQNSNFLYYWNSTNSSYVQALGGSGENLRGGYNASSNLFPSTGGSGIGGAIAKGDYWYITVAGVLGGQDVVVGSSITALVDAPAQIANNWLIIVDSVASVFGRIGNVVAQSGDYTINQITNGLSNVLPENNIFVGDALNKANAVLPNNAFNQTFETLNTEIKMDGVASIGTSSNIPRANHVHPSDTSKQNLILTPVQDNIVTTDGAGQTINSGKAFSLDTSLIANSPNKVPVESVLKYNIDYVNNRINNLPIGAGAGTVYYFTNDVINSYFTLAITPKNGTQAQLQATVNNNSLLLGAFETASPLNRTLIDAGIWEFNIWATSDSVQNTTSVFAEVYKISNTNVETLLFTINNSSNIGSTSIIQYSISDTQPSYAVALTDRLIIKLYAKTTRTQDTIVTVYYNSQQYYSHAHTPLIAKHNQLAGLNGGNGADEYYHLTSSQYSNVINQSSSSQNGYLSNTDWTTFNNKQNALTNPVTSLTAFGGANQLAVFNGTNDQVTPTTTLPTAAVPAFIGDITNSTGSLNTIISNNVVTNAKLNTMGANTVKMNATSSTANAQDVATNTAFNKNFETSTANIKMNGIVSVGSSGNAVNSDHVHPSDTSKQNIISTPTANNLVSVNNVGQVIDSGLSVSTISSTSSDTTLLTSKATQTAIANAITGSEDLRGGYDASSNLFPTTGGTGTGGAINAGNYWYITVAGTLGGELVPVGSSITALVNNPAQTASNWLIIQDAVNSVFGRTGAITAQTGDYTISQITNGLSNVLSSANIFVGNSSNISTGVPMSADATISNTGALTIANNAVTNAKLNTMATNTVKANITATSASPQDITIAQLNTELSVNTNTQYVTPNGSDTNNGYTPSTGVATLGQALTNLSNTAGNIFIAPKVGGYSGNYTITSQNINIVSLSSNLAVDFNGTLTFAHTASNVQLNNISCEILNHTGAGAIYMFGGSVTTSLTSSGSGYLYTSGVDLQSSATTVSITGAKSVVFTNATALGQLTINNSSAVVSLLNCLNSKAITLTSGIIGINNTTVYSPATGTNALTAGGGAIVYATNSSFLVTGTNSNALLNIPAGSFHSLNNCQYSPASVISGTQLTRVANFDSMKIYSGLNMNNSAITNANWNGSAITNSYLATMAAGSLKGNNTAGTANPIDLTSTQVTAMLATVVGDTGSGGTKGLAPAPAAGDGVAGKFLKADGTWAIPSGSGTSATYFRSYNTGATNGTAIQTITTTGTANWLTVTAAAQRLILNGNTLQNGGFTNSTVDVTIPTTGIYTITYTVTASVIGLTNREIWVQLVKTTGGTPLAILSSAELNGGSNNNGEITITYTGAFTVGDIIDLRMETAAGTPNVGINSYSLLINALAVPSTITQTFTVGDTKTSLQAADHSDWLLWTNGRTLSRTTYATLWSFVNTNSLVATGLFGAGDGTTTFTMGNINGRAIGITGSGTGLTARTLGASVGTETQTLTVANLPSHNHNIFGDSGSGIGSGTTADRVLLNSDGDVRNVLVKTTELTGSGTAHNNIQPTIFLNFFVFGG
jgi:microcystin-dependent protein